MPPNLTQEVLDQYGLGFFGYGTWQAKTWIIGLEERGEIHRDNLTEFTNRLGAWNPPDSLVDLVPFHIAARLGQNGLGHPDWNNRTWRAMRSACIAAGIPIDNLQDNPNWGGSSPQNPEHAVALIEAMPFPTRGINFPWPYSQFDEYHIQTRRDCAGRYLNLRLETLIGNLREYHPKYMILYASNYGGGVKLRDCWCDKIDAAHLPGGAENEWTNWTIPAIGARRSHFKFKVIVWDNCDITLLFCMAHPNSYRFREMVSVELGRVMHQIIH
jgi:hypothetical protein